MMVIFFPDVYEDTSKFPVKVPPDSSVQVNPESYFKIITPAAPANPLDETPAPHPPPPVFARVAIGVIVEADELL